MAEIDPVRPSAALQDAYEARLTRVIERMGRAVERDIIRTYRAKSPELAVYAQDASPARTLRSLVDALSRDWSRRFDGLADTLSAYFATATKDRCDRTIKAEMRKAGFTVRFKATAAMNDAYQAVIGENVGLIKSIPSRYFDQVRTITMTAVMSGGDRGQLASDLEKQTGIAKRRAANIARDQCRKASSTMEDARYLGMGITDATWLHSGGGKTQREPHVKFSGQRYSIAKGHDFNDGAGPTKPGLEPGCRCVKKPVLPFMS